MLAAASNLMVWSDRPGSHLRSCDGRPLLNHTWCRCGRKEHAPHLPQGCTQPGRSRAGSLHAGHLTCCIARRHEWIEAGLDVRLALIDRGFVAFLIPEFSLSPAYSPSSQRFHDADGRTDVFLINSTLA